MGNTLMKLLVGIGVDASSLTTGLEEAENVSLKSANKMSANLKKVGGSMIRTGGIMTAAITLPVLAASKTMITAASDLAEAQNAVNVVFGESAKTLENYAKTSIDTAGLSSTHFYELSTVTGAFLQNLGYDSAQAADETIKLTERAADMASVFNTDVSQALGAIQSGLKGEFNPLENFGVKLNAATIEAYALSHGLAATKSELTDNIKAQAALALIYEQTDKVAGDFVNTSDGFANSSRKLKERLNELAATLGESLLPVATDLLHVVDKLVTGFTNLPAPVQKGIVYFGLFLAVIGPLLVAIGSVISAIGTIGGALGGLGLSFGGVATAASGAGAAIWSALIPALVAIGPAILVLLPAVALLYFAFKTNFGGIRTTAEQLWFILKVGFKKTFHDIGITLAQLSVIIEHEGKKGFGSYIDFIKTKIQIVSVLFKGVFVPAVNTAVQWLVNGFGKALHWVAGAINYVIAAINHLRASLQNMRLPSWLTPGSPTPLELGLIGIAKGFGNASAALQNFQKYLKATGQMAPLQFAPATGSNLNSAFNSFLKSSGQQTSAQFNPATSANLQSAFRQFANTPGSPTSSDNYNNQIIINANVSHEQDWKFVAQEVKRELLK